MNRFVREIPARLLLAAWLLGVADPSPAEEAGDAFKIALLSGDAGYFQKISKADLDALRKGGAFSRVQDLCLANPDKLPQSFTALVGGLSNPQNVGLICQDLLYLDPRPVIASEASQEALASLHRRLDELANGSNRRVSPLAVAELKVRFAAPAPIPAGGGEPSILGNRRLLRVSGMGESRATAYTMTSLFFRDRGQIYLSWMDKPLVNCLGVLDPALGRMAMVSVLGQPQDDHGNAAIVQDTAGRLHAIVGAHHGPFLHRIAEDPAKPGLWRDVAEIGEKATHPSLVCDRQGVLHLTYRSSAQNPWLLCYQRYKDGTWTPPVNLLRAAKTWYVTWTNSLAVAPDNTLHLVCAIARYDEKARTTYFGSAHLYSGDAGQNWRQYGGELLAPPIDAGKLAMIESTSEIPRRTVSDEEASKWPGSENAKAGTTLQMLLSNAVTDEKGRPWVVVHNALEKSASLYGAENGQWRARADLLATVDKLLPGWVIAEQSALSRHANGELETVLPVIPLQGREARSFVGWQSNELELVRIVFDSEGNVLGAKRVMEMDSGKARWLPNLEKWDWNHPFAHPALLFSTGVSIPSNLEGEAKRSAKKDVVMEVWLDTAK